MNASVSAAPHGSANRLRTHEKRIAQQLQRFQRHHRRQVAALAGEHRALADLAVSFPALLFAIAVPHRKFNAAAVKAKVIKGQSLKKVAAAADLPLWSRNVQPEAFDRPLTALPRHDTFGRHIANHLPRRAKHSAQWLSEVMAATEMAGEAYAVWVARELPSNWRLGRSSRRLALWAWFSMQPAKRDHLYGARPWRPEIKWKAANAASADWAARVKLQLTISDAAMDRLWVNSTHMDGFDFVPLLTAAAIHEEAEIMQNCLRSYGLDLARNEQRLWSVRKDGKRVASLSVGPDPDLQVLSVTQIKGRKNERIASEVARAVVRWFDTCENRFPDLVVKPDANVLPDRRLWIEIFKPYFLWSKCIPHWLPLAPGADDMWIF